MKPTVPLPEELKTNNVPIKFWTPISTVESTALDQLKNVATLPWVHSHVAVMPDVHYGKGCTVGSVIAMKDAVSPASVGVDIGCGMVAIRTNLDVDKVSKKLKQVRVLLEETIPVGYNSHESLVVQNNEQWSELYGSVTELLSRFNQLNENVQNLSSKAGTQLGTLGGGNHFCEVNVDESSNIWIMLHSGSRNIGKELAEIHINIARKLAHNAELPDKDLAVFLAGTQEMANYRRDLFWAQDYARLNRLVMINLYLNVLRSFWPGLKTSDLIHCHHNYVSEEIHYGEQVLVTRKGAIRAGKNEYGIIPGSMGTKSYIVCGKGNPESFESASHGAGRKMSRGKAKAKFTVEDLRKQTDGVECRKDAGVLDEIPGAYKNIEKVMEYQSDLVSIEHELKQLMCIKG